MRRMQNFVRYDSSQLCSLPTFFRSHFTSSDDERVRFVSPNRVTDAEDLPVIAPPT
jgi:hypothetical protein